MIRLPEVSRRYGTSRPTEATVNCFRKNSLNVTAEAICRHATATCAALACLGAFHATRLCVLCDSSVKSTSWTHKWKGGSEMNESLTGRIAQILALAKRGVLCLTGPWLHRRLFQRTVRPITCPPSLLGTARNAVLRSKSPPPGMPDAEVRHSGKRMASICHFSGSIGRYARTASRVRRACASCGPFKWRP